MLSVYSTALGNSTKFSISKSGKLDVVLLRGR